jgi:hypothetical protein
MGGITNFSNSCKAWVNFSGLNGSKNSALNVSSVTRNSIGDYTVNFTTPMADSNYVNFISILNSGAAFGASAIASIFIVSQSTTSIRFLVGYSNVDGLLTANDYSIIQYGLIGN